MTLDSIQCISEADHTYYIKGTEFTPSSEIKLNGEWYDNGLYQSDYVDDHRYGAE